MNAGTGESAKGNVRGRAGETDETKYVQGCIETKKLGRLEQSGRSIFVVVIKKSLN